MRSIGFLLLFSSFAFAACAPAPEDTGAQDQNATGGEQKDASSLVYVFGAGVDPLCAGVLLSGKVAVVPRACIEGVRTVGKAERGTSTWARATVTKTHVPERGPADIAVLELSRDLGAGVMLVTHAPLRAGYTLFARNSIQQPGWGGAPVNAATSLDVALTSGTDTLLDVLPLDGKRLCDRDLGAMVCSSMETSGWDGSATKCGLAGIVVATAPAAAFDANGCASTGWKMAPLGLYAEFLAQYAPKAFQPERWWFFGQQEYAPEGLWGYETKGVVKSCAITTTGIDTAKANETKLVRAKASFEQMAKRAAPAANFGIAKKGVPTAVRWVPATRGSTVKAASFDETFTGSVGGAEDGEYIVALRVSADGGESWTRCEDPNAPLALVVGSPPTTPPVVTPPTTPPTTPPVVTPPTIPPTAPPTTPPAGPDADDDDDTEAPPAAPTTPEPGPKKKKTVPTEPGAANADPVVPARTVTTEEGCSASPHGASSSSALPFAGVLLGLAAFLRRRRL